MGLIHHQLLFKVVAVDEQWSGVRMEDSLLRKLNHWKSKVKQSFTAPVTARIDKCPQHLRLHYITAAVKITLCDVNFIHLQFWLTSIAGSMVDQEKTGWCWLNTEGFHVVSEAGYEKELLASGGEDLDLRISTLYQNKSNGVRTIDAIFLKLVPLYRTSTCSFELLPLKSSSDSHTFLFQTLVYRNFGQNRRFQLVCDGQTDRRTHPLIEIRDRI